jgi:hypothetical protein
MRPLLCALALALGLSAGFSARAQGIGAERANALPIADAHFHLMLFMTPAELAQRIDKNNVKWVVSAGAIGDPKARRSPWTRDSEVRELLGKRFMPAVGGSETYRAELEEGTRFFTDAQNKRREQVVAAMEELLKNGHRGIVETFPNAETSSMDPLRRRRVATNGPFFHELMRLSATYKVPVPMHMQWHPGSVQELGEMLAAYPAAVVVLSHCGKDTEAADIRKIMAQYPNVHCDLGFRSPPQAMQESQKDPRRTIYWGNSLLRKAAMKPEWLALVEEYPDRFMVAVDDVHGWGEYDEVVAAIRSGVLAQLSAGTAEKVAYGNAVRIFRLEE